MGVGLPEGADRGELGDDLVFVDVDLRHVLLLGLTPVVARLLLLDHAPDGVGVLQRRLLVQFLGTSCRVFYHDLLFKILVLSN